MKKNLLILIFGSLFMFQAAAQKLSLDYTYMEKEGPLNGGNASFYNYLHNDSPGSLELSWARIQNDLPGVWGSALCIGELCYDTATASGVFLNILKTGDSSLLSIYLQNDGLVNGTGTVEIAIWEQSDSANTVISAVYKYISWPVGIQEPISSNEFVIYPNPGDGIFNIAIGDQMQVNAIEVYDISGKLMKRLEGINNQAATLELADAPAGQYIVRVLDESSRTIGSKLIYISPR